MKVEQFQEMLAEKGINLSANQLDQYRKYYQILIEWNEKMNLTAITEKEAVYLKHFFDSLSASFYFDFSEPLHICDVGAGAGFPSIPIKIAFPNIKVTIVDSLNKRIQFLEHLAKQLELKDVRFIHDRAETFARKQEHRQAYDVVMARAVARLSVLSELCLPLVKVNGKFIAMKAANANEELMAAEKAISVLGGKLDKIHSFLLPLEESERNIILVDKIKSTPKQYPRKPGTPNKTPIE